MRQRPKAEDHAFFALLIPNAQAAGKKVGAANSNRFAMAGNRINSWIVDIAAAKCRDAWENPAGSFGVYGTAGWQMLQ